MKKIRGLLCAALTAAALTLTASAGNQVQTIDIEAVLRSDGAMTVTQTWEGTFDEGTEVYLPMALPEELSISGYQVRDESGPFETVEDWDISASLGEKAGKCGIVETADGCELCFGIGTYGQRRFVLQYQVNGAVAAYQDLDGTNFRFVNDGLNTGPTDVTVNIRMADGTPITDETCDIWAFGYDGVVEFHDGAITVRTDSPVESDNHVTVLFSLEKGLLAPERQVDDSFESLKDLAFEGSDYTDLTGDEEEVGTLEAVAIMAAGVGVPLGLVIWLTGRRRRRAKKRVEKADYFREAPNEGQLPASYALGQLFDLCENGAILGADILRLIQLGFLVPATGEETGWFGKTKEVVTLRIVSGDHARLDEYGEYLYTVLESAAGADGVLQPNELERFCEENDALLRSYLEKREETGRQYLRRKNCVKRWSGHISEKELTPSGQRELAELMGFRRYLEDFSLVAERGVKEIPIWQELLTYAVLFGIAERVSEQMNELYPDLTPQVQRYQRAAWCASYYSTRMRQTILAAQQARSGGSGGMASFGGGGGFVGGGSGGGTR